MENLVLKNRKRIIGLLTVGLVFSLTFGLFGVPAIAQQTETGDVGVNAIIEAWLNFEIAPTSLALGELVLADGTTQIGTDLAQISVGTNAVNGWTIQMQGTNAGLFSTLATHTIPTVTAREELVAGTDGYGAAVEPDAINGTGVTVPADYAYSGNFAGPVPSASQVQIASKDSANPLEQVAAFHVLGAADSATPAANDYADTITLTASTVIN